MKVVSKPLDRGAKSQVPNRVVVHAMAEYIFHEGKYKHAVDFLRDIGLSAHALICPDGTIIRCRNDNQGAYHARDFNKDSLGVEILVHGEHDYASFISAIKNNYMTFEQHCACVELLREWCNTHSISTIERHSDIDPERKHDPGKGFCYDQIIKDVMAGIKDD